jgi:hypothetical protein
MRVQGVWCNEIEQFAILLDESHRLESTKLDPWPLNEGPRPRSGKLRLNLHGTILEGKSIGLDPPKRLKRRAHDLKNQ